MRNETRETVSSPVAANGAYDVVRLADDLLARAAKAGASDVHFEPTAGGMLIRFRLDGSLKTVEEIPRTISQNLVSRLKVLGGLLTYRNDIPQEGRIESAPGGGDGLAERRLAVFPTVHGQRAVVRFFYNRAELNELDELGLPDGILAALKEFSGQSQGVLLATGPAGSGKSTTLAAILRHIRRAWPGKSIIALEDPVERIIDGVTQIQITPHGELTFPTALRSLVRQDPEVLMIGEIRDVQTARIVIEAGLTGHLLFSTMHSGTPAGAILRLLEMGIEPYQITSGLWGVLNQRLIRRLCRACKIRDERDGAWRAAGCPDCLGTGFKGRALLAELLRLDGDLRKAILAGADSDLMQAAMARHGHITMSQEGLALVRGGITTAREIEAACGTATAGNEP
ncbi:MAG: type II/IV secretion system protein [Planctomycetes bacterium]|nr:type II/IV secretion system protein [Planctomycetota bacterium]